MERRSTSRKYAGHLGQLTPAQESALQTFKSNLESAHLYTPGTEDAKPSHDDVTLIRFLRARRFDPAKAQKQFSDTAKWRQQHDVDNMFANFNTEELDQSRCYYPRWTGRRDKDGFPLYVYRLGSLGPIQDEITSVPEKRRYERIIALYESMIRFVFPLCTYLPHAIAPTPIACSTTIIDFEGATIRQMWSLRNHLQEASVLATANYPETLGSIAVVNAPSFFPTIWNWIKGWFDEGTRDKIHILGRDSASTLLTLVNAPDLPKTYGGELDWKFGDAPNLDDEATKVLGELPRGSVIFVDGAVTRPVEYKPPATEKMENGIANGHTNGMDTK
ncbi:CRAL/TRIO domain-containing protein [Rickenella mellea]|uniref:CRAL/TRIO domain-containing protein n=1 Tax=Rickenella mellea TaxID=50990 RepID=A0A4Y7Q7T7_9AGAM|nr:CRAL/TRIO domain-containing protein [Rickenella mellea]